MNNGRTKDPREHTGSDGELGTRAVTPRGPWAVLCAVATVVLGPAAVTATALDQANAAPLHHAVRADPTQAYIPSDASRRRSARQPRSAPTAGGACREGPSFSRSSGVPSGSAGAGAIPRSGATTPVSCS